MGVVVHQESLFRLVFWCSGVLLVSGLVDWLRCAPFPTERRRHGQGRELDDRHDERGHGHRRRDLHVWRCSPRRSHRRADSVKSAVEERPLRGGDGAKRHRRRNGLTTHVRVPRVPTPPETDCDGCGALSEAGGLSDPPGDVRRVEVEGTVRYVSGGSVSRAALCRAMVRRGSQGRRPAGSPPRRRA